MKRLSKSRKGHIIGRPDHEAAVGARANLLLAEICASIEERQLKHAKPLHLQMERLFSYEPIDLDGKTYHVDGRLDYSLWYGYKEDMSCKILVVETKVRDTTT